MVVEHLKMLFFVSLMVKLMMVDLFLFFFKDRSAVDINLVPFDCDGFMIEYGFSMNDMMRDDDM